MVDFHTAMRNCYAEKASLVSILNQDEQAYVNSMVRLFLSILRMIYCRNSYSNMFCFTAPSGGDWEDFCSLDWNEDDGRCQ